MVPSKAWRRHGPDQPGRSRGGLLCKVVGVAGGPGGHSARWGQTLRRKGGRARFFSFLLFFPPAGEEKTGRRGAGRTPPRGSSALCVPPPSCGHIGCTRPGVASGTFWPRGPPAGQAKGGPGKRRAGNGEQGEGTRLQALCARLLASMKGRLGPRRRLSRVLRVVNRGLPLVVRGGAECLGRLPGRTRLPSTARNAPLHATRRTERQKTRAAVAPHIM